MSSQYTNPTALEPLSDLHVETKCDRITNVSHHEISGDMFIPYQGITGIGTVEVKAPVMCNICGSVQSSRDHLKRHMKIHTGEKPFKCEYCDIRFSRKDHLNSHFTSARCIERRQRCQTFL
ncbi:ZN808-like protein [Mya arenaria]|uniref:ZN808-like protein n=1 Tax=Mya arenaria TaxID=6604 RepID=A0ABY7F8W1_MYAAR|nr:ZN808-like protein [Mya arenaria]